MPVNIARAATIGVLVPVLGSVVLAATAAQAQHFERQYRPQPSYAELPPAEARGCYYYRGRRYCGAYCYWEVNGKRYCQRRERDAYSQAPVIEDFFFSEGGMK
jgi:hypothetical protein